MRTVKLLEGDNGVARVIVGMVTHFGDGDISGGALLGFPHAGTIAAVSDSGVLGLTRPSGDPANAGILAAVPDALLATLSDLNCTFVDETPRRPRGRGSIVERTWT